MNREQAKKLLPIIQGYAEGKTVQYLVQEANDEWADDPNFLSNSYANLDYRIKPEPREFWYSPGSGEVKDKREYLPEHHYNDAIKLREVIE